MVANLNALSFGSAASSTSKNMPVGIPMASARVPAVELFDVVGYWWRSIVLYSNLVNGLRVQKQENARTFLHDSTINWGRCHRGTPPESYIKQIRRGWLRQLWPNILVRMCRYEDLSANPSRAPLYCGLCIDFWAPQLMIRVLVPYATDFPSR